MVKVPETWEKTHRAVKIYISGCFNQNKPTKRGEEQPVAEGLTWRSLSHTHYSCHLSGEQLHDSWTKWPSLHCPFYLKKVKVTTSFTLKESVPLECILFILLCNLARWCQDSFENENKKSAIQKTRKKKGRKEISETLMVRWLNSTCWPTTVTAANRPDTCRCFLHQPQSPPAAADVGKCFLDYPVTTEDLQPKQS